MDGNTAYQEVKKRLGDRSWRLQNLYTIVNKRGVKEKFKPNIFQKELLIDRLWYLSLILKARQLGISTGVDIFGLDMCLFNSNTEFGIIDATLPDAKKKLEKCKYAYDNLPKQIRDSIPLTKDNETELKFANGSKITAGTSFRGSTLQILHISEYAKICKRDPIKAREIRTGALNALSRGQFVFIESTAEDADGDFYDIASRAEKLKLSEIELSELDYKFFFFPWYEDQSYTLDMPKGFVFSTESTKYFNKLVKLGINLRSEQKYWYVKKLESQGLDMKKEFPSTSKEAFEAFTEDKYYKELMLIAESQHRITEFDREPAIDVDIHMDIGRLDYTSVIFSQTVGKEIRLIDFFEINGEHVLEVIAEIKRRNYRVRMVYLPHDATARRIDTLKSTEEYIVEAFGQRKVKVLAREGIELGINEVRKIFGQLWFKRSTTVELRDHLEKYCKKWNERLGRYLGPDKDGNHSHAADALRYLAMTFRTQEAKDLKTRKHKPVRYVDKPMGGY